MKCSKTGEGGKSPSLRDVLVFGVVFWFVFFFFLVALGGKSSFKTNKQ